MSHAIRLAGNLASPDGPRPRSRGLAVAGVAFVAAILAAPFLACGADFGPPASGLRIDAETGRETATSEPRYRGTTANAPIPPHQHKRNEGGSDGAGLCVICSLYINGRYQGIPEDALARMWATAKSRPGGYSPDKLQQLLDEVMPGEKWASYVGRDTGVLDRLSRMGYPVGATMNTGELYNWAPIHHMVSLAHFDKEKDLACVVDNNRPGVYSWMSAREYERRWIDGGTGWAFVWLRRAAASAGNRFLALAIVLASVAATVLHHAYRARQGDNPDLDAEDSTDGR